MPPEKRPAGFTLVELLLVLTLIAVLTGVAVPKLTGATGRLRLDTAANELAQAVRFGRAEAIRRRCKVQLELNVREGWYVLRVQTQDAAYEAEFDTVADELFATPRRLPQGVRFESVATAGEDTVPIQTFEPTGLGEPCEIPLRDREGRQRRLVLGAWWDDVQVITPGNRDRDGAP